MSSNPRFRYWTAWSLPGLGLALVALVAFLGASSTVLAGTVVVLAGLTAGCAGLIYRGWAQPLLTVRDALVEAMGDSEVPQALRATPALLHHRLAEAEGRMQKVESLIDLVAASDGHDGVQAVMVDCIEYASAITGARYAAFSTFDANGQVLDFYTLGMDEADKRRIGRMPRGGGLLGHLQRKQQLLRLDDMSQHPAFEGFPEGHPPMTSLLAVPLVFDGESVGSIYLSDKESGEPFTEADEYAVKQMARLMAVVIKGKQATVASQEHQEYLSRSIDRLLGRVECFAAGDLTVRFEAERDDEVGALCDGFNRAVANLRDMIERVSEVVTATANSAEQIRTAAEQLASGSRQQSAKADEMAAAVEEMSCTISENARGATAMTQEAQRGGTVAQKGHSFVSDTATRVHGIASAVERLGVTVERLSSSSEKIGEVIRVIDEVADQTNLLALNAAIEAARAGEYGRGFAVVADEVRKLAERTTNATAEIADVISAVQQETQQAVTEMDEAASEVAESKRLADDTRGVLDEIVASATAIEGLISQIAAASEEQSVTSEQISRTVQGVSQVAAEASGDVGQIAEATDGLNRLTRELYERVAQFKTEASDEPPTPVNRGRQAPALHRGAAHAQLATQPQPAANREPAGACPFH